MDQLESEQLSNVKPDTCSNNLASKPGVLWFKINYLQKNLFSRFLRTFGCKKIKGLGGGVWRKSMTVNSDEKLRNVLERVQVRKCLHINWFYDFIAKTMGHKQGALFRDELWVKKKMKIF